MQKDSKARAVAGPGHGSKANKWRSGNPASAEGDRTRGNRTQGEACQERVLDEWQRNASSLDVFLRNGTRIRGILKGFDPFVMAFDAEDGLRVVYKQAVMTIAPAGTRSHEEGASKRPVLTLKRRGPSA
jgi:RNA chaperone Hfq